MRQVHVAKDPVEAHMVKELLEARGIAATVVGHYEDPFAASVWIAENALPSAGSVEQIGLTLATVDHAGIRG
jgi:hypothetical protein